MVKKKKILASIIIINFNNAKYLKKSINSALNQSYKEKEVIVIDDKSNDSSIQILKNYKNKIKFFVNSKKTKYGSFNQMNSLYTGYLNSNGKYLFFLDSDDYFKKNKLKILVKKFEKKNSLDIIFDLPIFKYKKKLKKKIFTQKKFIFSNWPRFTPQSCISVKKKYAKVFFKILLIKKFPTLWFDFRLASFTFLRNRDLYVLNEYLTYYRQLNNSASKKYKFLFKNWWIRRKEAHEFFSLISKKLGKKNNLTLDQLITKFVNIFLNE